MSSAKLCLDCFRKHFGAEAKIKVVTWSAQCGGCHKPTPSRGLLIKTDVFAEMAK